MLQGTCVLLTTWTERRSQKSYCGGWLLAVTCGTDWLLQVERARVAASDRAPVNNADKPVRTASDRGDQGSIAR